MSRRAALQLHGLSFQTPAALQHAARRALAMPEVKEQLSVLTCQRHELYVIIDPDRGTAGEHRAHKPAASLPEALLDVATMHVHGSDASLRLFRIAAGDLSHVPGERAIAEQLRSHLRAALRRGEAGSIMATLTRRALNAGESLRTRVEREVPILELADLVALFVAKHDERPLTMLGGGALGRSIHDALDQHGIRITRWATRSPQPDAMPTSADWPLEDALRALENNALLITALGGGTRIHADSLPKGVIAVDLGEPANIHVPTVGPRFHTSRSIIEDCAGQLAPQAEAVRRAAHRLAAKSEAALAETICPTMADVNRSIAAFRERIVEAELQRLSASLDELPPETADRIRRSIRHTAARSVHPLHEYVNALGRQNRADEAQLVVDHLLGSRIGWSDPAATREVDANETTDGRK